MNGFQQALEQGCAAVGLDPADARLLRLGSNAVYHLTTPVIARISRPGIDVAPVRRNVAVARWLESADYPAVRALHLHQPVIATATSLPSGSRSPLTATNSPPPPRSHRFSPASIA